MKSKVDDREHFCECHDRWSQRTNRHFDETDTLDGFTQCMFCIYFIPLCGAFIEDYGVCSNKNSLFDGYVRYEHDGCEHFVEAEEMWQKS